MSIALATQARRLLTVTAAGLLPLYARVTLWITTAIHLDTPTTQACKGQIFTFDIRGLPDCPTNSIVAVTRARTREPNELHI